MDITIRESFDFASTKGITASATVGPFAVGPGGIYLSKGINISCDIIKKL